MTIVVEPARARRLAPLVLALALGVAPVAVAAPTATAAPGPAVEARALYRQGLARYRSGAFDEAIALFEAAYAAAPAPDLRYDIAQALRRKGDCAGARDEYQRFLASGAVGPHREHALRHLTAMESCVQATAAAPLAPTAPPVVPPPPPAAIPALSPAPAVVAAGPAPASAGRTWGASLLGAAALSAGAGGFMSLRAHQAGQRTHDVVTSGGTWDQQARSNEQSGQRADRIAIGLYAVAAACASTGAWLLLRDEAPASRVDVALTGGGAVARVRGSF